RRVADQPVELVDAVVGHEADVLGTGLDDHRVDRRVAPLLDQLLELVDRRGDEVVPRRIREGGDGHGAALLCSPEFHCCPSPVYLSPHCSPGRATTSVNGYRQSTSLGGWQRAPAEPGSSRAAGRQPGGRPAGCRSMTTRAMSDG